MDEQLKRALQELEDLHAAVWTHFDPGMDRGDKDQPKEIKEALKAARKFSEENGHTFDGWGKDA